MKNNTRRTTRQKIFLYIKKEIDKNGYLPSLRQIGKAVGLASPSSVKRHVDILESEGWIPAKRTDSAEKAYTETPVYTEKQLSEHRFPAAVKERLYLPCRQRTTACVPYGCQTTRFRESAYGKTILSLRKRKTISQAAIRACFWFTGACISEPSGCRMRDLSLQRKTKRLKRLTAKNLHCWGKS